jgi:hypothetical protein
MTKEAVEAAIAAVENSISTVDTWVLVFAALVAIGVVGEAVLGVRHWILDDRLHSLRVSQSQLHENELTALRNDTARLTTQGDEARAAIAGANERAAEATQKAQEASLELAKFKAPRVLTEEQRGRIVDKLKQFSGTEYDIAISDSEPEILSLVFAMELVLSTAGWTELDWQGTGQALIRGGKQPLIRLGASVTNVLIVAHTGQPAKLFEFALALSNALKAEGVEAVAQSVIPHEMSSTNANAIHILIGRKQ